MTPKQHIAYVCGKNARDTEACCYKDNTDNEVPAKGISRIIGEWSASYDTLPVAKLADVMEGIEKEYQAPEFYRQIPKERKAFLRNFVEAQMVTYETIDTGVSRGWFYWTLKMEGGAFAEWDFLRGLEEGWIPPIPNPSTSSESLYGTCHQIAEKTVDDVSIIHEFPDPSTLPDVNWQGVDIDDDFVVSHAGSLGENGEATVNSSDLLQTASAVEKAANLSGGTLDTQKGEVFDKQGLSQHSSHHFFFSFVVPAFFIYGVWHVFFKRDPSRRYQYSSIDAPTALSV